MDFGKSGLPDSPMMRRAFLLTQIDATSRIIMTDDGKRLPSSMDIQLRTAHLVQGTIAGASDEQIAGALMFLTHSFARSGPILMSRSGDDKLMPNVYAWAKEWQGIQRGAKPLQNASRELRQIITAASVAQMEEFKANFAALDRIALVQLLAEKDLMNSQMDDIGAPALTSASKTLGNQLNRLLQGLPADEPAAASVTAVPMTTLPSSKFKPKP